MNDLRSWLVFATLSLVLSACAPSGAPPDPAAVGTPAKPPLPAGVERLSGPPELIRFPAASLYRPGAALPGMAGLDRLEKVAAWLLSERDQNWQVVVTAGEEDGQDLAARRLVLLQRFFSRQGLNTAGWDWQTEPDASADLRLVRMTGGP